MEERTSHRVSIKVAIYSPDGKSVLTTNIPAIKKHGLPGGHLNPNEAPLVALKRELFEELAIEDVYGFELKDSWWHGERNSITGEDKLVLGFIAKRDSLDLPPATHPEVEFGEWLPVSDLDEEDIGSYARFVKEFQPILIDF